MNTNMLQHTFLCIILNNNDLDILADLYIAMFAVEGSNISH